METIVHDYDTQISEIMIIMRTVQKCIKEVDSHYRLHTIFWPVPKSSYFVCVYTYFIILTCSILLEVWNIQEFL